MATWKMCNRGHWYRNQNDCPTCSEKGQSADNADDRARIPLPRTQLQIIPA